jgi:hypothetical protein
MATAVKERRPIRGMEGIVERPDGTRRRFIPYPTPLFYSSGSMVGAVNMISGERVDPYETLRQRGDGSLVDVSVSASPLRNSAGEVVGASKIGAISPSGRRPNWP